MKTILLFFIMIWGCTILFAQKIAITDLPKKIKYEIISETRDYPITIRDSIPTKWLDNLDNNQIFQKKMQPGEYFVFQIAAISAKDKVDRLHIQFNDLKGISENIPASAFTCFNEGGIDYTGKVFSKTISIDKGKMQALWIGVQIPENAQGEYKSSIIIHFGKVKKKLNLVFTVSGAILNDGGISNPQNLARLQWLNFTRDINDKVTKAYSPIKQQNNTISIIGRDIQIGNMGLPQQIYSYFSGANDILDTTPKSILSAPFRFIVELADRTIVQFNDTALFTKENDSRVSWHFHDPNNNLELLCNAYAEFDGFIHYDIVVIGKNKKPLPVRDIRLEFEMTDIQALYSMGMGLYGGFRPQTLDWKWDVENLNQDMIWLGNVNGGIRLRLKDQKFHSPLLNIYYKFLPLHLPDSWGNDGKGGFKFHTENGKVKATAYSGSRSIKLHDTLYFNFDLLVTPLKLLDKEKMFHDRYCHVRATFENIDTALNIVTRSEANIMNIHHAKEVYPYINYPFSDINTNNLKNTINQAHDKGIRTKVYYTTREMTVNAPEFWALKSLNGEVLFPGPGNTSRTLLHAKPDKWLIQNVREDYVPAWTHIFKSGRFVGTRDLSILTTPDSRLNNFYIGGLDWMCQNLKIDGVYLDDCALDRTTIRRTRKVIDAYRPEGRIDMQSWNHFCPEGAWANCINLYMDFIPYIDLLWLGEGRDYDLPPDNWLIEVSGIPFGITSQMLQNGGNLWRGMIYGITNRAGWARKGPSYVWKFWDAYQIQNKEFIGYWDPDIPVTISSSSAKATVYKGEKQHIIAIANFSSDSLNVPLQIQWDALDIKAEDAMLYAPAISDFQESNTFHPELPIPLAPAKGWLLILEKKSK